MLKISQIIPKEQKDIIINALTIREIQLKKDALIYTGDDLQDINYELFDINTLKKILQYEINVVLNDLQYEHFSSINKVDFPIYDVNTIIF